MNDKPPKTIDERLEFLLTSTESLHASTQELHAMMAGQAEQMKAADQKQRALQHALLAGIREFLKGLDNGDQ
ncbi:MAG TPA: hypothetical protein VIX37_11135 [Candidatus Sulfotelmatobacter sp.]